MNTESQSEAVPSTGEVKLHFNTVDLRGARFGNLTVEERTNEKCGIGGQKKWRCRCDCGEIVMANQTQLRDERITICQKCVDAAVAEHIEREKDAIRKVKSDGVKSLPSKAFLEECFLYNPETGILTWKRRPMSHFQSEMVWNMWLAHYEGKTAGKPADRRGGKPHAVFVKISIGNNRLVYLAHRIIGVLMDIEIPDGMEIDHKDRNPFNNRFENLRVATSSQNGGNTGTRKPGKLKGAFPINGGKFLASINNSKIGVFNTEEEAHAAYCEKAKEKYGEFFCAG